MGLALFLVGCSEDHHGIDDPGWERTDTSNVDSSQIKVMTYNIHYGYPVGASSVNILSIDPDIALLQELDKNTSRSGNVDQLAQLAELTGMKYSYFGKAIDYNNGEYGVGILSKYALENEDTTMLPIVAKQNADDYVEQRVLAEAQIIVQGQILTVATSHLDLTQYNRDVQVPAIHAKLSLQSNPVIFGGDFNARPANSTITDFQELGYTFTSLTGFSISDYLIDFITYRPSAGFELVSHKVITAAANVSDHYPVVAILKLK